jgi:glycosyltransferase involved in cell wall biosynthesis
VGSSVAVVVPAYNAPPYLAETLRSIMAQSHSGFSCLIVDDGSTDDTAERASEIVAADRRFRVLSQSNQGVGSARNTGAAQTQSDLIAFMDCDDVWDEAFLASLIRVLGDNPSSPAAHCVAQGIGPTGTLEGDFASWSRNRQRAEGGRLVSAPPGPTSFESLVTAPCIASPGAGVVRRGAFDLIGGFNPDIFPVEDWDLWIRLSRCGDLAFLDEPLFLYRRHSQNLHQHNLSTRRTTARLRRATIGDPLNSPDQKAYSRTASRTFYLNQGREILHSGSLKRRALGVARIAYSRTF